MTHNDQHQQTGEDDTMNDKQSTEQEAATDPQGQLDALVSTFLCWLLGHKISYIDKPCDRCGSQTTYHEIVTPGFMERCRAWGRREFGKCNDCGKRFGDHSKCIPF